MKVELLHIADCPNTGIAEANARAALDALGLGAVPVELVTIGTEAEAANTGFGGSLTILVDGIDLGSVTTSMTISGPAVPVFCIAMVWSCWAFCAWYWLSRYCFWFFKVWIIAGIAAAICGVSSAIRFRSGTMSWKSSDILAMPSRESNTDRMAAHIGMSKQCGSQ